ncbi:MAG TPA: hypothetical protein VLC52_02565 [Anaerolineae bacterium]|nr:hypothetical protein [Anaerolineae bacterium]
MAEPAGIDAAQRCLRCGGSFTVRALVERIAWFWPEVDVAVSALPCCQAVEELRLEDRKVWRGYVYAAGAPHFSPMEACEAPALVLKRNDSVLVFELDGVERVVERKR